MFKHNTHLLYITIAESFYTMPPKTKSSSKKQSETPTFKTIELMPSQVEHVNKLNTILSTEPVALDLSSLGSGKTFTSSYIAMHHPNKFKHVVVIAPVSVKTKWQQIQTEYGVPVTSALSFAEMRSVKLKQPKHGLLYRRDYTVTQTDARGNTKEIDKVAFAPTETFQQMITEGCLLVVDEIQNLKNVSTQFLACQTMIKSIVEAANKSKVLLLSGSPIDKKEQAIVLFRTMHISKQDRLASMNPQTFQMIWQGMQDIYDYCKRVNPEAFMRVVNSLGGPTQVRLLRDASMRRFCYDLFQEVVKPAISSAMLPPVTGVSLNKRNGFYHILDNAEAELLTNAVFNLSNEARLAFSPDGSGTPGGRGLQSLRAISVALMQIETAKIGTFTRIAREALSNNPNQKVAICVNYTETINDLVEALSEFNPLVLNGQTSVSKRIKVLANFQTPSTEHRLIIGNVAVMSTGIDLDDKHGDYPRIAFVSANYRTIDLYQLGFRFLRSDTRSAADIYFVYGQHAKENKILEALAAKSKVMKDTTPEQSEHGVVFPNDHESFDEIPPTGFTPRQVSQNRRAGFNNAYLQDDAVTDALWNNLRNSEGSEANNILDTFEFTAEAQLTRRVARLTVR